jgi:dolichol-phosphate mannosyltransferase
MVNIPPSLEIRMRCAVVIPTYNEAENIRTLASRLLALEPKVEVVIVDDASPDGTGAIGDEIAAAEPRFHVIHRTGPRGYSVASKEGMSHCIANGFEMVATMDADLSHDPDSLARLRAEIEAGADLAIGSRYCEGGESLVDWGPMRRAVSVMGSSYARIMVGTPVHDCTSGFRCYRATTLARIPFTEIRSEGYSFLIELLAALRDINARIVEVPITYVDRQAGHSKISNKIVREALGRTTMLGVARLTGSRRRSAAAATRVPARAEDVSRD